MSYNIPCGATVRSLCRWGKHLLRYVGAPTPTYRRIFVFQPNYSKSHDTLQGLLRKMSKFHVVPPYAVEQRTMHRIVKTKESVSPTPLFFAYQQILTAPRRRYSRPLRYSGRACRNRGRTWCRQAAPFRSHCTSRSGTAYCRRWGRKRRCGHCTQRRRRGTCVPARRQA